MYQKYKDGMYNEEIKLAFLSRYSGNSGNPYKRVFKAAVKLEQMLEMDLYQFGITEIENLLHRLHPKTRTSSLNNISNVSSYLNWAIENGYRTEEIPFNRSKEWVEQFVIQNYQQTYINSTELKEIVDMCINRQDGVIFQLLW